MKKKLFQDAFKKAENQCGNSTKHGLSNHLEKVFTDDLRFPINRITFVRYYEKYIEDDEKNTSNPNSDLLNKLSEYLGYKNYEDFVLKNIEENKTVISNQYENLKGKNSLNRFFKNHKTTVIVSSLLLFGFIVYYSASKQRWMVWDENNYVEVTFNTETYNVGQLELYNENKIKSFKKINADCNTEFFDATGNVKIWYGKNKDKALEYFTDLGLHPETGKTLHPITTYMIRKHICEDY